MNPEHNLNEGEHRAPVVPMTMSRVLPHSLEAEEYLLSCCLMDGAETVAKCRDSQITPETFYDPKHGLLFDVMVDMAHRGIMVEIAGVAEELKTTRQLDQVGGYAFLSQVSSRIPTTAQTDYFIEKVREQATLRDLIRAGTTCVAECYNYSSGEISTLIDVIRDRVEKAASGAMGGESILAACKFNPAATIIPEKVLFKICGIPMATAGNLGNLVSAPGVGKSAVVGAMIAAAMVGTYSDVDCLGWTGSNETGLPLLHFDTEQSLCHYQHLLHRSLRRSQVGKFPAWFHSYHLTGKSASECRQIVEKAIFRHALKAGGLWGVIIDGWADLLVDPNDGQEVFPFVARMHSLAIKYDMPIFGALHLNPGSEDKSRGHLGSQLERKAETVLQLEMDAEQVTTMWAKKRRGKQLIKDQGPRFCWNHKEEMHCQLGNWKEQSDIRMAEKQQRREERMEKVEKGKKVGGLYSREEQVSFYPSSTSVAGLNRLAIHRLAKERSNISDKTLDRVRRECLEEGLIELVEGGYRRTKLGDEYAVNRPGAKPAVPLEQDEIEL